MHEIGNTLQGSQLKPARMPGAGKNCAGQVQSS